MRVYVFPGQGSQHQGMGGSLFREFKEQTERANRILGYSIERLCLEDPERRLGQTEFTQPALYVVNALTYLQAVRAGTPTPDYLAGHSLGEYSALFAAGVFDFELGLRLVKRRGELMSRAPAGGMAAVLSCPIETIRAVLAAGSLDSIDVANFNSPKQIVLAGPVTQLERMRPLFEKAGAMFIPLNVSAPFHSRYMRPVVAEFEMFLREFRYAPPNIPVIANVDAQPYGATDVQRKLTEQLCNSVQWTDTIQFLLRQGPCEFRELGPGDVLTKLIASIVRDPSSVVSVETKLPASEPRPAAARGYTADRLGAISFTKAYGLRCAYVSGAMYNGIASKDLVVKMGKAGFLGFLGTGGMQREQIRSDIEFIRRELAPSGGAWGMNLLHTPDAPEKEATMVDLFLASGVRVVEASAYIQMTPALVRYRLQGLRAGTAGRTETDRKVIAKVSRPEIARMFLSPPPEAVVVGLVRDGLVTPEQAELARRLPMADDLCAEADSGGHTDGAIPTVLLPTMLRLRDALAHEHGYDWRPRVGAAGGLGTPEAVAAAFVLGADFVVTGSINQCTVEAATSDQVKDMLQQLDIQDTEYAPAGDMFEIGAKVQVMKRGVFFPSRANKLHALWSSHSAWEDIDDKTRRQVEEKYLRRSFDAVYSDMKEHYRSRRPAEIEEAERNPKRKMALVFRWYFLQSSRAAQSGDDRYKVDYQVHTGPAMGAFNQWVKGTELEDWRNRHVDDIGRRLMEGAAEILNARLAPPSAS